MIERLFSKDLLVKCSKLNSSTKKNETSKATNKANNTKPKRKYDNRNITNNIYKKICSSIMKILLIEFRLLVRPLIPVNYWMYTSYH